MPLSMRVQLALTILRGEHPSGVHWMLVSALQLENKKLLDLVHERDVEVANLKLQIRKFAERIEALVLMAGLSKSAESAYRGRQ